MVCFGRHFSRLCLCVIISHDCLRELFEKPGIDWGEPLFEMRLHTYYLLGLSLLPVENPDRLPIQQLPRFCAASSLAKLVAKTSAPLSLGLLSRQHQYCFAGVHLIPCNRHAKNQRGHCRQIQPPKNDKSKYCSDRTFIEKSLSRSKRLSVYFNRCVYQRILVNTVR